MGTEVRILRSNFTHDLEEQVQKCIDAVEKRLVNIQFSMAGTHSTVNYAALLWFEEEEELYLDAI